MSLLSDVKPAKVAILRASRIGDFLLAVPALRSLRHKLPQAEITLIGLPRVESVVRRCRYVNHFAPFPGFPGIADQFYDPRRAMAFLAKMQAAQFDLAIQLHGSGVYSNIVTSLLGARYNAGFCRKNEMLPWLTLGVPFPDSGHEVNRLLSLTAALGAEPKGHDLEFPLLPEDEAELDDLPDLRARGETPLVVLHPGAEVTTKRWPAGRFAAVGSALARKHRAMVAVTGLALESELGLNVATEIGHAALDLTGRLSIVGLGALLRRAMLLITNDTAPAHIAYALGTPSVTIFGPQEPARWGPLSRTIHAVVARDVSCRPCDLVPCPLDHHCIQKIGVDEVLAAADTVLGR